MGNLVVDEVEKKKEKGSEGCKGKGDHQCNFHIHENQVYAGSDTKGNHVVHDQIVVVTNEGNDTGQVEDIEDQGKCGKSS